jgi:DNA-binding transcriptional LysR family regulator
VSPPDPAAGEVRVGSSPLLAASFTTAIVDRLSRRYPRMMFRLTTGYVEELHRGLSEREFDLLIAWKIGPLADERLRFEFLFDDTWVIATGVQNPWARRRKIAVPDLMREPWVLPPPEAQVTSMALEALAANGFGYPRKTVVSDSPHVRMSLLATGRFLTICPMSTLRFSTARLELKVLPA